MEANRILLANKYARIINLIAEKEHITRMQAMKLFYESDTVELLDEGVADLHCECDAYLADEVRMECFVKEENPSQNAVARMMAYDKALSKILAD